MRRRDRRGGVQAGSVLHVRYENVRVYSCEEQVEFVSMLDRSTYRAFDVRLCSSAMMLEQYRAHNELYAERSAMYV